MRYIEYVNIYEKEATFNKELTFVEFYKRLANYRIKNELTKFNENIISVFSVQDKTEITALVLDIDIYNNTEQALVSDIAKYFKEYEYIFYTTKRSTAEAARGRLILNIKTQLDINIFKNCLNSYISFLPSSIEKSLDKKSMIAANKRFYLPHSTCLLSYNAGETIELKNFFDDKAKKQTKSDLDLVAKNAPISVSFDSVKRDLFHYKAEDLDHNGWLETLQALHHQTRGSEDGLKLADGWSKLDSREGQYKGFEHIKKLWLHFNTLSDNPITWRTVLLRLKEKSLNNAKAQSESKDYKVAYQKIPYNYFTQFSEKFVNKTVIGSADTCLSSCYEMLDYYKIKINFDVIKKELLMFEKGYALSGSLSAHIKGLMNINKLKDNFYKELIDDIELNEDLHVNKFKEWVINKNWDGKDRIKALCDTIIVNEMYNIKEETVYSFLKHWLMEFVKLTCFNSRKKLLNTRSVLIFQGREDIGKTYWFKDLLPVDKQYDWFLMGSAVDLTNRMKIKELLSYPLVELGEFDGTMKKVEYTHLKNFISSAIDNLDIKHKPTHTKCYRSTMFCATANPTDFLSTCDVGSNSGTRFLIIPVTGFKKETVEINGEKVTVYEQSKIDLQQLYAQLYHLYDTKGEYKLNEEERTEQMRINNMFKGESTIETLIDNTFNFNTTERLKYMNATEIAMKINEVSQAKIDVHRRSHLSQIKTLCLQKGLFYDTKISKFKMPPLKCYFEEYND